MRCSFHIFQKQSSGRWRFLVTGNPLALLLLFFVLFWLSLISFSVVKLARDYYSPYEGKVISIKTRWTDYVTFEDTLWEHLIIETPEGTVIDRFLGLQTRLSHRIAEGDYVVKKRGFGNRVRPRGKKTSLEIIESFGQQHP